MLTITGKHFKLLPQLGPVLGSAETFLASSLGQKCLLSSFLFRPKQVIWFCCQVSVTSSPALWAGTFLKAA